MLLHRKGKPDQFAGVCSVFGMGYGSFVCNLLHNNLCERD